MILLKEEIAAVPEYIKIYEEEINRQRKDDEYIHEIALIKLDKPIKDWYTKTDNVFVCDINIATALNCLNILGYNTVASCEGHLIEKGVCSLPYVMFDRQYPELPIPIGWQTSYKRFTDSEYIFTLTPIKNIEIDSIEHKNLLSRLNTFYEDLYEKEYISDK